MLGPCLQDAAPCNGSTVIPAALTSLQDPSKAQTLCTRLHSVTSLRQSSGCQPTCSQAAHETDCSQLYLRWTAAACPRHGLAAPVWPGAAWPEPPAASRSMCQPLRPAQLLPPGCHTQPSHSAQHLQGLAMCSPLPSCPQATGARPGFHEVRYLDRHSFISSHQIQCCQIWSQARRLQVRAACHMLIRQQWPAAGGCAQCRRLNTAPHWSALPYLETGDSAGACREAGTGMEGLLAWVWPWLLPKCAEAIILPRMLLPAPVASGKCFRQGPGKCASGTVLCAAPAVSAGPVSDHAKDSSNCWSNYWATRHQESGESPEVLQKRSGNCRYTCACQQRSGTVL